MSERLFSLTINNITRSLNMFYDGNTNKTLQLLLKTNA